jgi:hypothetical protein
MYKNFSEQRLKKMENLEMKNSPNKTKTQWKATPIKLKKNIKIEDEVEEL